MCSPDLDTAPFQPNGDQASGGPILPLTSNNRKPCQFLTHSKDGRKPPLCAKGQFPLCPHGSYATAWHCLANGLAPSLQWRGPRNACKYRRKWGHSFGQGTLHGQWSSVPLKITELGCFSQRVPEIPWNNLSDFKVLFIEMQLPVVELALWCFLCENVCWITFKRAHFFQRHSCFERILIFPPGIQSFVCCGKAEISNSNPKYCYQRFLTSIMDFHSILATQLASFQALKQTLS